MCVRKVSRLLVRCFLLVVNRLWGVLLYLIRVLCVMFCVVMWLDVVIGMVLLVVLWMIRVGMVKVVRLFWKLVDENECMYLMVVFRLVCRVMLCVYFCSLVLMGCFFEFLLKKVLKKLVKNCVWLVFRFLVVWLKVVCLVFFGLLLVFRWKGRMDDSSVYFVIDFLLWCVM